MAAAKADVVTKVADDTPRWVRIFNWCCLAVALVALVLLVRGVGLGHMRDLMVGTGVWFAYVVASGLGVLVLETLALRRLLGKETRGVGFGRTMATMLAGQAINAVTPGGKLGEATKVMLLGRWLSRGAVLAAVVKSNVINFFISVTVVAIGVPLIAMLFHLPTRLGRVLWAVGAGVAAFAVLLAWLLQRGLLDSFVSIARRLKIISAERRKRWKAKLQPLDRRLRLTGPEATRDAVRGSLLLLAARALAWLEAAVLLAVLWHFDWRVWLGMISAGLVVSWVGGIVPLGLGVTEGGAYLVFDVLGAPPAIGLGIVLIGRVRQAVMAGTGLALLFWLQTFARGGHDGRQRDRTALAVGT